MKAVSVLAWLLMAAGLLGLFYTHALLSPSPVVIVLQAAAVVLMVWARVTFGRRSFHASADTTEGGLVTTGPYRYMRNPIYTSVVLFAFAGAGAHLSVLSAAFALVSLGGALARIFIEERFLRAAYPGYADYAARTRRMVPYLF